MTTTHSEHAELALQTASLRPPRALRREGLVHRAGPFITAALAAMAVLSLGAHASSSGILLVLWALTMALVGAVFVVPWARLPRWTEMSLPTAYIGMVWMFRLLATETPRVTSAPLLLLAVLWVALHGTRRELAFELCTLVAAFAVETVLRPMTPDDVGFAAIGMLVVAVGAFAAQELVYRQRRLRAKVARERDQLGTILGCVDEGIVLLDAQRRLMYANGACGKLLGLPAIVPAMWSQDDLVDHLASLTDDPVSLRQRFARHSAAPGRVVEEYEVQRPVPRTLQRTCSPARLVDGDGYVVIWRDVTAEKALHAQQAHLARTDTLTGVANRRAIDEVLDRETRRAADAGTPLSVAVLDIDHFKAVNDTYGHAIGDDVLRTVASTLAMAAPTTSTVARWGGEEFVVVLPGPPEVARLFCERAREVVAGLALPNVGRVTVSVGLAAYRAHESVTSTIARADAYLYAAKRSGRNRVMASQLPCAQA